MPQPGTASGSVPGASESPSDQQQLRVTQHGSRGQKTQALTLSSSPLTLRPGGRQLTAEATQPLPFTGGGDQAEQRPLPEAWPGAGGPRLAPGFGPRCSDTPSLLSASCQPSFLLSSSSTARCIAAGTRGLQHQEASAASRLGPPSFGQCFFLQANGNFQKLLTLPPSKRLSPESQSYLVTHF